MNSLYDMLCKRKSLSIGRIRVEGLSLGTRSSRCSQLWTLMRGVLHEKGYAKKKKKGKETSLEALEYGEFYA